ncbi:hypothetical protein Bca4012_084629 [Brassica carinata]
MGVSLSSETKHLTPSPRLDRNPLSCGLGQIISCRRHLFPFCKQRSYASFLDDKLSVAIVITGKRNEGRSSIRAVFKGSGVEKSNMLPDEAEDELVGGKRRKTKVISVTVILSGSGDTEEPRNVTESGGGDDGEDALHDAVGSALEDEGKSLVQYLLRVIIN